MNRQEVLKDIRETLGIVPKFFDTLPDPELEYEWGVFKNLQLGDTNIPNKYKELIGLAVSATLRCKYCVAFHTATAKMNGASDDEIKESLRMAKLVNGWSTYLNGSEYDMDLFRRELEQIGRYVTQKAAGKVPVGVR